MDKKQSGAAPFQKELLNQKPKNYFEVEVKKSYQRILSWSVNKRMSEIGDEEENMLRHVQLKQTRDLLNKYKVSQMNLSD